MLRRLTAVVAPALLGSVVLALGAQQDAHAVQPAEKIAFSEQDSVTSWIALVTPSGSSSDFEPPAAHGYSGDPAWSPDGSRLAYVVTGYGNYTGRDIWVMDADGRRRTRLTRHGSAPAWSPDGGTIAFVRSGSIYLMNADGSGQRRLIRDASSPAWSPDGQQIAFVRGRGRIDNTSDLYVMSSDGTDVQRLTKTYGDEANPDWSPDGTTIAYDRTIVPKNENEDTISHVFLMNADGTRQRRLMKSDSYDPSWSPDGNKLVYGVGGDNYLFTINANGTGARKIYPLDGPVICYCYEPAWSKQ